MRWRHKEVTAESLARAEAILAALPREAIPSLNHIAEPIGDMTKPIGRTKNMVGLRIGRLDVLMFSYRQMTSNKAAYYLCRCDCGSITWINGLHISYRKHRQCIKCNKLAGGRKSLKTWELRHRDKYPEGLFPARWAQIQRGAKSRGLEFDLSYQYACELYALQGGKCALTGMPISFDRSKKAFGSASLDRKKSHLGYIPGNVQWVHKLINRMKQHYTNEVFVLMCRFVCRHTEGWELNDGSDYVVPSLYSPKHPIAKNFRILPH